MLTYIKDPAAQLLRKYRVPFRGIWKTIPSQYLPEDVLSNGENIVVKDGYLRSRPGMVLLENTEFTGVPIGSILYIGSVGTQPIVMTTTRLYSFASGTWNDETAATFFNGSEVIPGRMTILQVAGVNWVFGTDGVNIPLIWNDTTTLQAVTVTSGSLPVFRDVTTIARRLIGVVDTYDVRWGNPSLLGEWPTGNVARLTDTADRVMAIRSLGTLGGVIYKASSIWNIYANAGLTDSEAFRFEHMRNVEGPAGPAAVVDASGVHIYMTSSGRIGMYDGASHRWIGDGIWPFLKTDVDSSFPERIHGAYDSTEHEVYFFYRRAGDGLAGLRGLVIVTLPYPEAGITTFGYYTSSLDLAINASLNNLQPGAFTGSSGIKALLFGRATKKSFFLNYNAYDDLGVTFTCNFQTGLTEMPEGVPHRLFVKVLALRDATRGVVKVQGIENNLLSSQLGTPEDPGVDLDLTETPADQYIGLASPTAYGGVKFTWTSTARFQYTGCDLFGYPAG